MNQLAVVGAPSSAGAQSIGLEKGPSHFRRAGLMHRLLSAGLDAIDLGDTPVSCYVPDIAQPRHRNVQNVARVARDVADKVDVALRQGARPLVVGGDCTVTVGMVLSAGRRIEKLGLMYVDAQTDLNTPETSRSGILDSMGLAHMIGHGADALTRLGSRYPLMAPERVVAFGYDPAKIYPVEERLLTENRVRAYTSSAVKGNVVSCATEASQHLQAQADAFIVHFDVDVVSFVDFPVADVPLYHGRGLDLDEALSAIDVFVRNPRFAGLSITELNADLDPDGKHVDRLLTLLVPMLVRAAPLWDRLNTNE